MKNNVYYSPESLNDLNEVWDYIISELCNPDAAQNTVGKIMNVVDHLEDFSEIGAPLSSVTNVESDYRFLISGNYIVFYRISVNNVYIDRILYGRRNYLRILFPDLHPDESE